MNDKQNAPKTKTWLFGPEWTGRRCEAKTRNGGFCKKPALKGKSRCQLHGGRGGAPPGEANGNYRTGKFTKGAIERRKEARRRINELLILGKKIGMFG